MTKKQKQDAKRKAYIKEHYDTIHFYAPKGLKNRLKEEAQKVHTSVSDFIRDALEEKLNDWYIKSK